MGGSSAKRPSPRSSSGALCHLLQALTGFTNKALRQLLAVHLAQDHSASKMSYDLRRLRLHGLITRLPPSNTYLLTPEGIRVALFYTKLSNQLLKRLLDTDKPPAKTDIRRALTTLEHAVDDHVENARLAAAT
jgi:predicted MarR family transcription regulator